MKTQLNISRRACAGYALAIVLVLGAISITILASTMARTGTTALQNDRNNQYVVNLNAAEAAVEKVIARLSYDFQTVGLQAVNANLAMYRTTVPTAGENSYWNKFQFSDGQGQVNRLYVSKVSDYTGSLPSQYPGLFSHKAPLYRVLANVRTTVGPYKYMTNAVQEDVLLALLPLTQYAIFYNSLLEFSTCETMTVNGRTHANGSIYVGSSKVLTFNGSVTAKGTVSSPKNNGQGPWSFPGNVDFNGSPGYKTNVPTVSVSINMTNTHSLIDYPSSGVTPGSVQGQQLLYNQAQVVLQVSNTSVSARIQTPPGVYQVPGEDPSPVLIAASWTNGSSSSTIQNQIRTNFPFLTVTNRFLDQREDKTNFVTQIDVGKYDQWISTNVGVLTKFPAGSATYPTILFAADNRTVTSKQLAVVRLTNGIAPPENGGLGWSVATPNPLYVWGNYNCRNSAHLASTNTSSTVPCALMSDALTILSSSWRDSTSYTISSTGPSASSANTVNAAILTGIVPSTGNTSSTFSGGVHNLPRMLENWSSKHLWLNTSIINLFNSTKATGQFVTPGSGSYYVPPVRHFSFDVNFLDYDKVPPGIPCALVAIRMNWAVPPANTLTYNVSP